MKWRSTDHPGGDTACEEPKEIRRRVLGVLVRSGGGN